MTVEEHAQVERETAVGSTLACVIWLMPLDPVRALEMRDEFMREVEVTAEEWDAAVDEMIDYARRHDLDTDDIAAARV